VSNEFYKKLVDLYAGRELPAELEDQMELAAFSDQDLSHDMATLRRTVDFLQTEPAPEFTEESYQRILMKLYARGAQVDSLSAPPAHMQYHLPMRLN
jgi:hypothetical protein